MNFLAHAYLSFDRQQLLVGNFMADFVKGNRYERFPEQVAKGVLLHREIDHYTDRHPLVRSSKRRLRPKYRHYSGVIVDMFYDHFLAANFSQFHHQSLGPFTRDLYRTLADYQDLFPKRFRLLYQHMSAGNWLLGYAQVAGIELALAGMARRTRFNSNMEQAGDDLKRYYQEFYGEFMTFFPQVVQFAKNKIPDL